MSVYLIDDCHFNRAHWEKRLGHLNFRAFASVDEAARHLGEAPLSENALIFLDYELQDGSDPARNAERVLSLGFRTLFITTAHDAAAIEPIAGVSGVINKEPPSWLLEDTP